MLANRLELRALRIGHFRSLPSVRDEEEFLAVFTRQAVKEIDLSGNELGVASAIIIAGLLKENTTTESLK